MKFLAVAFFLLSVGQSPLALADSGHFFSSADAKAILDFIPSGVSNGVGTTEDKAPCTVEYDLFNDGVFLYVAKTPDDHMTSVPFTINGFDKTTVVTNVSSKSLHYSYQSYDSSTSAVTADRNSDGSVTIKLEVSGSGDDRSESCIIGSGKKSLAFN